MHKIIKFSLFLSLFLFINNLAFGYTISDMRDFASQLSNNVSSYTTYQRNAISQFLNQYNSVLTALSGHNEFTSFVCINNGGSNLVQVYCFTDDVTFSASNQRLLWSNHNNSNSALVIGSDFNAGTAGSNYRNFNQCFGLVNGGFVYPSNPAYPVLFQDSYIPPFEFRPYFDIKYNFDNNLSNVLKRDYSVTSWDLGIVEDFGNYDYYEFTFNFAYSEEPLYSVKYDSNTNKVNGSVLAMSPGGQVSINSRYVEYNVSYKLNIYLYTNNNVTQTKTFYYRFLPVNAVIGFVSGDSGDGFISSVGSGDYNTQDSTNAILDSSEVDDIMSEYLSGDIESLASDFGFTPLDNPFTTFLLHILESTYDALTYRAPVVLTASYNGITFSLNSVDFVTPDSPFKTFLRSLLIFLYIYGNYKYFHYLITLLETARIDKAIAEFGTDEFYDSDIM